jgi:hypothetical protein
MVALKGSWVYGFIDKPILARLIKQKITVFIRNLKGVVIEE